jgi:DNA-binding transcriptional regulator YiaG
VVRNDQEDGIALLLAEVRRLCTTGEARALREANDLALAELARDVGVSETTLSEWERGRQRPTGVRAVRYLGLLRQLRTSAGPAWAPPDVSEADHGQPIPTRLTGAAT